MRKRQAQRREDPSRGLMVLMPEHPHAIESGPNKGYVEYPNVDYNTEMVNALMASRAYEANITAIPEGGIFSFAASWGQNNFLPNFLDEKRFQLVDNFTYYAGDHTLKTGINVEGPAPRPLERYKVTMAEDGQLLIDKNVKFQEEKGEWENPDSYILV